LLSTSGWWCKNNQSSHSQNSSPGSQDLMLQAKKHAHFVWSEFKNFLNSKINPILDESVPETMFPDVIEAHDHCKIGNQQTNEKIKAWMLNNKNGHREQFLNYFTSRAHNADLIETDLKSDHFLKHEFYDYVAHFYFASVLKLNDEENKVINDCLSLIFEKIEEPNLLDLQLAILDVTENEMRKEVKGYFHSRCKDYFGILESKSEMSFAKLKLAVVLEEIQPTGWKNWKKAAFKKY